MRTRNESIQSEVATATSQTIVREVGVLFKDGPSEVFLDFAAAGVFEILLILTEIIGQNDTVVLLDEPALNLHPTKQLELSELLQKSVEKNHNQIILITHSVNLVNTVTGRNILRFFKQDNCTHFTNVLAEVAKRFGGSLSSSDFAGILFSSGIVIVEGPSDKYAVERFDSFSVNSLQDANWVIVSAGGKKSVPTTMNFAIELDLPFVACVDRDTVMECDSKIDSNRLAPLIFKNLVERKVMSSEELQDFKVQSIKEPSGEKFCYRDEDFERVKELAMNNRIFPLRGTLEQALIGGKRSQDKVRGILETIEENYGSRQVPDSFREFFEFARRYAFTS